MQTETKNGAAGGRRGGAVVDHYNEHDKLPPHGFGTDRRRAIAAR